jgi:hypothetical protein
MVNPALCQTALANPATDAEQNPKYQEVPETHRPLGEEPVLVSKIQVKPGPGNNQVLCMHPEQGQGLEIAFDSTLLHSFCKLLAVGVKKTDWDLELRVPDYTAPVSQTTH